MGDYRYPLDETTDANGIVRTADEAFIPVNPDLGDWVDYLAWRAVPNTPDPFTATALGDERRIAKAKVDHDSETEFEKDVRMVGPASPAAYFAMLKMIQEALEIGDGMAFAAARHPMINELIGVEGATGADVATAIRAWWDGIKVRVGQVNSVRWDAHKDIDAAGSVAAARAVYTGITWPA